MIEANLVKKAYIRILPVQVLACVVAAVNSIIDGLITARFIGTQAMAAVGFFVPVCTIIGISQVVSIGVQILCSKYVGSGKKKNAVNLFSSGVVFVSLYAFVVSLSCIFFRAPLSSLLGKGGDGNHSSGLHCRLLVRSHRSGSVRHADGLFAHEQRHEAFICGNRCHGDNKRRA